jgi:hypothetical protein
VTVPQEASQDHRIGLDAVTAIPGEVLTEPVIEYLRSGTAAG